MLQPSFQPTGDASIAAAAQWTSGLLVGSIGTSIAVLAIAGVGLGMLQGKLSARTGLYAVLGCFVLFGAPTIAAALVDLARGSSQPFISAPQTQPPAPSPPPPPISNPDPYAGASVPM